MNGYLLQKLDISIILAKKTAPLPFWITFSWKNNTASYDDYANLFLFGLFLFPFYMPGSYDILINIVVGSKLEVYTARAGALVQLADIRVFVNIELSRSAFDAVRTRKYGAKRSARFL